MGDQLEGQLSIVGYQRGEMAVPEIGQVYKITTPEELTSQFIRITAVVHSVIIFTCNNEREYVDVNRRNLPKTHSLKAIAVTDKDDILVSASNTKQTKLSKELAGKQAELLDKQTFD